MTNQIKSQDLNYVQHIHSIDIKKIGEMLNQGVHHRVYYYGEKYVLKVPRERFNFLYSEKSHLDEDLKLLKLYAGKLIIKTIVHASEDHHYHCVVQERLSAAECVTPKSVIQVWSQFEELLSINKTMMKRERALIDFLGGAGFISCFKFLLGNPQPPYLSNVVIYKGKIKILDTDLIRLKVNGVSWEEILRLFLSTVSFIISALCLKLFFHQQQKN
jgi:hypothetical protein